MKKSTKKHILNILIVIILALIMFATLSSSSKELNFSNIKSFFASCNLGYIGIAFLCLFGFIFFEALSLHVILKKLGYKPKFYSSFSYSTADTYYSAITPSASGGQPASAYYMIKDGIDGGTAGFSLIFNLVGYTSAIIILGILALIFGFDIFISLSTLVKVIIILGLILQISLLVFFIMCMRWHTWVTKFGYFIINVLHKLKILKKKDKWIYKVDSIVYKYKNCYQDFKNNKRTLIPVIVFNILQRLSQILISVFVCLSAIKCDFSDLLIMQTLVVLGYNSIPLPGGIGAFEYLYIKIYSISLPSSFIIISMMVTRVISYYLNLIASGVYTIAYHLFQLKRKKFIDDNQENKLGVSLEIND